MEGLLVSSLIPWSMCDKTIKPRPGGKIHGLELSNSNDNIGCILFLTKKSHSEVGMYATIITIVIIKKYDQLGILETVYVQLNKAVKKAVKKTVKKAVKKTDQ